MSETIYSLPDSFSTPFTADIRVEGVSRENHTSTTSRQPRPSIFLSGIQNAALAFTMLTSPQVDIPAPICPSHSVTAPLAWGLPRKGHKISLRQARALALQVLAEAERDTLMARKAEADFLEIGSATDRAMDV